MDYGDSVGNAFNLVSAGLKPVTDAVDKGSALKIAQALHQQAIADQQRQNQFVTSRNAAAIAAQHQNAMQLEQMRESSTSALSTQQNAQSIARAQADAAINQRTQMEMEAHGVNVPTKDEDGNPIPIDDLSQDIATAHGKMAQNLQKDILGNNAKIAQISFAQPDYAQAAAAAARNVAADPRLAAQVKPDTMEKVQALVAAQGSNPLGLANLIYSREHGIGSYAIFGGGKDSAQAAIIQSALSTEMDRQIAAQTDVKTRQAMMTMSSLSHANDLYQAEYAKHFAATTPDMQEQLLSPDMTTHMATGGSGGGVNPATWTPPRSPVGINQSGNDADPNSPPPVNANPGAMNTGTPANVSPLSDHLRSLADADTSDKQVSNLQDDINTLRSQKADLVSKASSGQSGFALPTGGNGAISGYTPLKYSPQDRAALAEQADQIQQVIDQKQKMLEGHQNLSEMLKSRAAGVPQTVAQPSPFMPIQQTPFSSTAASNGVNLNQPVTAAPFSSGGADIYDAQNHNEILQRMQQIATQRGATPQQMNSIVQAAQSGDPSATNAIRQAYTEAQSSLMSTNFQSTVSQ